jgi:hypothetical protein
MYAHTKYAILNTIRGSFDTSFDREISSLIETLGSLIDIK